MLTALKTSGKATLVALTAFILSAGMLFAVASTPASAAVNDGTAQDVQGDEIDEVWTEVKDRVVEYLPEVLAFLGSFLGIVIVIMLIRRGIRRMTGMVTSVGTG